VATGEQGSVCVSAESNTAGEPEKVYAVVNTTTANLLGEFDTFAEAQGFIRDLGDYADNVIVVDDGDEWLGDDDE